MSSETWNLKLWFQEFAVHSLVIENLTDVQVGRREDTKIICEKKMKCLLGSDLLFSSWEAKTHEFC